MLSRSSLIKISAGIIIAAVAISLIIPPPPKKIIKIEPGMTAADIGRLLKKENIIKSEKLFRLVLGITGKEKNLKAGSYSINTGSNYLAIIRKLVSGSEGIKVTIPEGWTTEQIARRLHKKGVIHDEEEFIKTVQDRELRGFLFPETYNFLQGEKIDNVLKVMVDQFYKVFTPEHIERTKHLGLTVKELVNLASLIEKEAKVSEERPIISAVFHKRLKKGMYLESCASVLFALGEHKDRLTYEDLEIDSPYNTYRNFGLPPTPIANPGKESLYAALYPADTNYLFFFSKGDGSHIFSSNYSEHLRKQKE